LDELPKEIAGADICLGGPFGQSDKADRVIPGKVYQVLAMRKPLIAACTTANIGFLEHKKTAFLCRPGEAGDLSGAIAALAGDPELRANLAENGFDLYRSRCSEAIIAGKIGSILESMGFQG
jgi:hypothetical protein